MKLSHCDEISIRISYDLETGRKDVSCAPPVESEDSAYLSILAEGPETMKIDGHIYKKVVDMGDVRHMDTGGPKPFRTIRYLRQTTTATPSSSS